MAYEYLYKISSRYLQKNELRYDIKHVKTGTFHVISGLYRDLPNFIFWQILTLQKVFKGFFAFFEKIWPKTCITALNPDFLFDLFSLVTWDYLDLYYDHKAQEMISTNIRDTIHATGVVLYRPGRAEALPIFNWALPIPLWALPFNDVIMRIFGIPALQKGKYPFFFYKIRTKESSTLNRTSKIRT